MRLWVLRGRCCCLGCLGAILEVEIRKFDKTLPVAQELIRLPIKIRHIQYVIAAADHGSFRRAAAMLGVRESAISRCIRNIEDEVGAALFVRSNQGVKLTYAGRRFVYHTQIAIDEVGRAAQGVSAIGRAEDGVVRIGILSPMVSGFLAELFRDYGASHAGVRLNFIDNVPPDYRAAVRQHRLDVIFASGNAGLPDCDALHLWSEQLFIVLPARHRLAALSEITWCDLHGETFVFGEMQPGSDFSDYLTRRFAISGIQPITERHSVGRDNLMQIVSLGRGLTLVTEAVTVMRFPGVIYRPLAGEELPFSAVWSPKNDNPALRAMLSLARKMSKTRSQSAPTGAPTLAGQMPTIDSVALSRRRDPLP